MFAKIKLYAIAALGFALTILYALLQKSKADQERLKRSISDKKAEVIGKAAQANLKGEIDEHGAMHDPVDKKEDYF